MPKTEISIINEIKNAHEANKIPAFAYDRISALAQAEGISLEYQENKAAEYAARTGLHIVYFFTVIESARKEGRRVFNEMFALSRQFNIKNIIFKNTDRMSRNYTDLVMLEKLIDKEEYIIHLYQNNKILNAAMNHNDRFMIGIEIAVAKQLSDKISHDIRASNLFKAKQGIPPARFPIGYLYDKEKKVHYKDPKYENMLNFIFDTFDESKISIRQMLQILIDKGYRSSRGKQWTLSYLHNILTKRMYTGQFEYHGDIFQAKHEPYLSVKRYEKRLKKLGTKYAGARKRTFEFLMHSFLRCGHCSRVLTGEIKKGRYIYYTHRNAIIPELASHREEDILNMINNKIESIKFSQGLADWIKKLFKDTINIKQKEEKGNLASLSSRIANLELKRAKLLDLFLDEELDRDALKSKMDDIRQEIKGLQSRRQDIEMNTDTFILAVSDIIEKIRLFPDRYHYATNAEKIESLRSLADTVFVHKDFIEIKWKTPFNIILSPEVMDYASMTYGVRKCPDLRAREDSFRTFEKAFQFKVFETQLWFMAA